MAEFKISNRQFMVLIFLQIMGVVLSPGMWAGIAREDGWLAELAGIVYGLLVLWLFSRVANLNPELNLIGLMRKTFGNLIGKIVVLNFIFSEFIAASINVWGAATFITTQILPSTPKQAVVLLLLAILIVGVKLGLETIARVAEILVPFVFFYFILSGIMVAPNIHLDNIQPVLSHGITPVAKGALMYITISSCSLLHFLLLVPFCNNQKKAGKSLMIAGIAGCGLGFFFNLCTLLVLGVVQTTTALYPSYLVITKINIGDFLTRFEAVGAMFWLISSFFAIIIYLYAVVQGVVQIFNLKDRRSVTMPLGIVFFATAMIIFPSTMFQINYMSTTNVLGVLLTSVVIPLVLYIVAKVRGYKAFDSKEA
ncbi:MAG: spore gernimation protein [Firmicutes bacterium]|nr:spore gernimation protein [Bacillota bacterium]